jgi:hypothetical protein
VRWCTGPELCCIGCYTTFYIEVNRCAFICGRPVNVPSSENELQLLIRKQNKIVRKDDFRIRIDESKTTDFYERIRACNNINRVPAGSVSK